jgi:hypothetical protein
MAAAVGLSELLYLVNWAKALREELEKIVAALKQLQIAVPGAPPGAPGIPVPLLTVKLPNNSRHVFVLDLNTVRDKVPLGVSDVTRGKSMNCFTCIKADGPLEVRINSPTGDGEPVSTGYSVNDFEVSEVYVSNEALGADKYAVFVGEWIV